ncbi:MAG: 4-(cytidine 5'-diphospho)-2-C-methyl-D-erythritol kinase [Hyphomicrobiales bacterium]|nr:4-(cytidine 5'-diphospho)-2-C-methyl-D-erythritol kinase [Hyphomicrobiales bacterium]
MNKIKPGEKKTITAHAKINLALHVTGQRQDGYHLLDSLVCFTDFGDRLTIKPVENGLDLVKLDIVGPFADSLGYQDQEKIKDNLVTRAAMVLAEEIDKAGVACCNVHIILEKNLPVASGIGGGSADAAAVLLLLVELWGGEATPDMNDLAIKLGADIPMCLDSRPKRIRGTGELISEIDLAVSIPVLLVNPNIPLSTPEVFAALGSKNNPPISENELVGFEFPDSLVNSNEAAFVDRVVDTLSALRNDLQDPAVSLVPEIRDVIASIRQQPGCRLARMSGSGTTCFGIFGKKSQARAAMIQIKEQHRDWWSIACSTIMADTQKSSTNHHDQRHFDDSKQ